RTQLLLEVGLGLQIGLHMARAGHPQPCAQAPQVGPAELTTDTPSRHTLGEWLSTSVARLRILCGMFLPRAGCRRDKTHEHFSSPSPSRTGAHMEGVVGGASVVDVASGTVNQKVDPSPGALSTPTLPPWRSTIALLIERPSPRLTPEPLCTVTASIRGKRSHIRACSVSESPGPASRTATRATRATRARPLALSPSSAPSASTTTS